MSVQKGLLAQSEKFAPEERIALKRVLELLDPRIDQTLDQFYSAVARDADLSQIISKGPGVEALKRAQTNHWRALLAGEFNEDFRQRARAIGSAHRLP
jgi:methyl-accepting chemotaxis protein